MMQSSNLEARSCPRVRTVEPLVVVQREREREDRVK